MSRGVLLAVSLLILSSCVYAGNTAYVSGYVLNPDWYSPHRTTEPPAEPAQTDSSWSGYTGWGYYEYGVSGNVNNSSVLGFYAFTNAVGVFANISQPEGVYTLASGDVHWRSAYAFNKGFLNPFALPIPIRLHANMWAYGPNFSSRHQEIGQTFIASGTSVTMIRFVAADDSSVKWKISVHETGPTGAQIGPSRTKASGGELCFKWSANQIPTIPGNTYYVKLQALDAATNLPTTGAVGVNDPVPDLSDPMPEGCMYLDGVPQGGINDLALTICSDDDGMLTNYWVESTETWPSVASAGQTFVARGTSLISFCAWIPQQTTYSFYARVYDGLNGAQVGTTKLNKIMPRGDNAIMWLWSPGECPLVPRHAYYVEVTKENDLNFPLMVNRNNEYESGQAYVHRIAQANCDLCGTIMEEESPGSAARPQLEMKSPAINNWPYLKNYRPYPIVMQADRGPNSVTIRWETFLTDYSAASYPQVAVPTDATIEYSEWTTPYTDTYYDSTLTSNHTVTLTNLKPNTLYHFGVKSAAGNYRTAVSHDLVAATINSPDSPNLLANPGFEEGSLLGDNPNARSLDGWNCNMADLKAINGQPTPWRIPPDANGHGGIYTQPKTYLNAPPYAGSWYCEGSTYGFDYNGLLYQKVQAAPGVQYNFTCAISSWMKENSVWKYNNWEKQSSLDYLRIGIDPAGGTDPLSSSVKWTNRFYSHLRFNNTGTYAVSQGDHITAYIELTGLGGAYGFWHLYGIDDCRLTAVANYQPYELKDLKSQPNNTDAQVSDLVITATPAEAGAYYAQSLDRSQGIRIESTETAAVGTKLTVKGTLQSLPSGERYLAGASFSSMVSSTEPKPMMMLSSAVGGSAFGTMPAVPASKGPHNTALAVKIAGTVTVKASDSSYIYISDGSLAGDGIKVDTSRISSAAVPNVGDVIGMSGISSIYSDEGIKPLIIARRSGDISADFNP